MLDRVNGQRVLAVARAGKRANLKIISEFFPADAWNFVCFLPGAHYGTDRDQRQKTLLICVDSRHFIEGFENGNVAHDPYVVYPQLREKLVASLGLEHMGEMEAAEDFTHNTMVPTGRPEHTFMVADDNDYCARLLIRSAQRAGSLSPEAKEGLLLAVASIFRDAEDGEFALAALRLEKKVLPAVALLSALGDLSAVSTAAAVAARLRRAE